MNKSTASFTYIILAVTFSPSVAIGIQSIDSGTQNVTELSWDNISSMSSNISYGGAMHQAEESKILYDFISDIINNSKPMPAEFAQLVNDNFWDLVD